MSEWLHLGCWMQGDPTNLPTDEQIAAALTPLGFASITAVSLTRGPQDSKPRGPYQGRPLP